MREVRKYTGAESVPYESLSHNQIQMHLFRAQRNLYISGFALFLSLFV